MLIPVRIFVEGPSRIAPRFLGAGIVGEPAHLKAVLGHKGYAHSHGSLDPSSYCSDHNMCVVQTMRPIHRPPVIFEPRREALSNLPTTVIAVNGLPNLEDVKQLYTDTAVDKESLQDRAWKLKPDEISGGPGDRSHYCVFDEFQGPPKVRKDVPMATGQFLSYFISTLPGSSGGLVVRGGAPVAMHLGSNGGVVGKITKDTVGYGLAVDSVEVQSWLSGMGMSTSGLEDEMM